MKPRTEPSQRQRKPDDVGLSADVTAVTGTMAPSTAPFVAKSPAPPPTPGSASGSVNGTVSLLTANSNTNSNRHNHNRDEVNSALSSTASSLQTGRRSSPGDGARSGGSSPASDEAMYLLLGSIQGVIGVVMAVFGVMALVRDASMASTGSGIWGGAVAVASGTIGVVAGLRSCYSRSVSSSSVAPTAFMASSLVAIATANLVLVLTAIGLARDLRDLRTDQIDEDDEAWRGVVASCGLVLASALQLLVAIASAYRCYRVVCPCASRRHQPLYSQSCAGSPDSFRSTLKSNTKDRLVSHWLTGASDAPSATMTANSPVFPGSPTPSGLLLFSTQPPPPGHHPQTVYTLPPPPQGPQLLQQCLQMPPMPFSQYPSAMGAGGAQMQGHARPRPRPRARAMRPMDAVGSPMTPGSRWSPLPAHRKRHHHGHGSSERRRLRREGPRSKSGSGRTSPLTSAQVAKTYTGLDRKMAEDFLTVMDHGRHSSTGTAATSNSGEARPSTKTVLPSKIAESTADDF